MTRPAPVTRVPSGIGLVEAATFAAVVVALLWLVPYSESGGEADRALALRLPLLLALAGGVAAALSRRRHATALESGRPRSIFALLALAWLGWTALSALLAPDPWRSLLGAPPRLQGWITLASGPLLALAWLATPARPGRSERLVLAPRLAGTAAALYALLQAAGLDPLRWEGLEALRPGATQGNPVFLGAVLVLVAPFSLAAAIDQLARGKRRAAVVSTAAYLTQLAAAGVAGGRAALLALGAGALVQAAGLASSRGARRTARRLLTAAVVALLVLGALALAGRLPGFDPGSGTARQRWLLWTATVDLLASEPARLVTGFGPEGLALALPRHLPEELPARVWAPGRYQDRAHNFELDLVASLGVPGLLLALALFAAALYRPLRRLGWLGAAPETGERGRTNALDAALVAALAGHLVELQLGFRTVATDLLFWVVAALAAGRALAPSESAAVPAWPRRALGRALVLPLLLLGFATVVPSQGGESRAGLAALLLTGATLFSLALASGETDENLSAFLRRELPGALVAIAVYLGLHGFLIARGHPHVELLALVLAALSLVTVGLGRALSHGAPPIGTSPLALPALAALGLAVPWVALPLAGGVAWKLGATDLALGRADLAVASLERAVALDAGWTEPRLDLALARLRRAAALDPGRQRAEIARVEKDLLAWRARHPLDPAIDEQLGFLYARRAGLASLEERRRWLERSLDRHRAVAERLPASGAAQRNLGAILLDLGELPEALERLEAGVRLAPRSLEGQLLLARGRLEARELPAAEKAVRAALALDRRRTLALLESLARAEPRDLERQLLFALAAALAGERDAALGTLSAVERRVPVADRPLLERIRSQALQATDPGR